jgi:uncharacterized BrkB/YihY/UPF0761 family membrane protein
MEEHLESLKETLTTSYEQLEARRKLGVPLAATRRFFEIEGLDLGGLLALELFTTVIPLILIGFGWASDFSSRLSFGDLLIRQLQLTGSAAKQVRDAFGSGASLRSTWTVLGLASFLVWGIPMSSQVAKTFARAWRRERYPFFHEVWRGAVWFALFLGSQAATVAVSPGRVHGVGDVLLNLVGLIPQFLLWFATPAILVRNGANAWRQLAWCGLTGVLLDTVLIRLATRLLLPALLQGWVGFGPIGVAMTLMTWCTVAAALWVITACIGAVMWERTAPVAVVVSSQIDVPPKAGRS